MRKKKNSQTKSKDLTSQVKEVLAQKIGVEPDDITGEDSFLEDLHMSPTDLSDFISALNVLDIDTSQIDLTDLNTLNDLIDLLSSKELIE